MLIETVKNGVIYTMFFCLFRNLYIYILPNRFFLYFSTIQHNKSTSWYKSKIMDSRLALVIFLVLTFSTISTTQSNGSSSSFNNSTTTNSPLTTTDEVIDISKMTLEEVCTRFNIPSFLCVCDNTTAHPVVELYCRVRQKINKPAPVTVVCTSNTRGIIMTSISIVGVIGNSLVITVTKQRWRTSTVSQQLIGALALSDFVFSLLTFIAEFTKVWSCKWLLGKFMCKLILPSINMTATMALGFILIISIERFFGVVYPFNQYVTKRRIKIMILVNILFSLAVVIPQYAVVTIMYNHTCAENWSDPSHSLIYTWVFFCVTFLIPIIAISVFYIKMLSSIRASQQKTKTTFNAKQQMQRKQEDQRITIILACLLITFVVLVFPNRIYWILYDHNVLAELRTSQKTLVINISNSAYLLHAAINPFIYSIVDKRFRSILSNLFCGKRQRRNNTITDTRGGCTNTAMETDTSKI